MRLHWARYSISGKVEVYRTQVKEWHHLILTAKRYQEYTHYQAESLRGCTAAYHVIRSELTHDYPVLRLYRPSQSVVRAKNDVAHLMGFEKISLSPSPPPSTRSAVSPY